MYIYMYIFPYLRTCARGIPHERRRTDIRKIIMPCLNARGLQSKLLITPIFVKIANSNVVPTSRGFRWYPYFGAQE